MYYEEKIIDGILKHRSVPRGKWEEMSKEELTKRIKEQQKALKGLSDYLESFRELIHVSNNIWEE